MLRFVRSVLLHCEFSIELSLLGLERWVESRKFYYDKFRPTSCIPLGYVTLNFVVFCPMRLVRFGSIQSTPVRMSQVLSVALDCGGLSFDGMRSVALG